MFNRIIIEPDIVFIQSTLIEVFDLKYLKIN